MSLNDSALISEIEQLEERLLDAMRSKELSCLENIFSHKYVFLGSDGSTWGKDKALEDYQNPEFELSRIETHNQQIVMHENIAIVTGISLVVGKIGEEPLSGRYFFMVSTQSPGCFWSGSGIVLGTFPGRFAGAQGPANPF